MKLTGIAAAVALLSAVWAGAAWSGPAGGPRVLSAAQQTGSNWAGYAVSSPNGAPPINFTSVTGTWKQVSVNCTAGATPAAVAIWVGLGGFNPPARMTEQIGTWALCSGPGVPTYYAWYQILPDPPLTLPFKIHPGDTITTSVNVSDDILVLQLKNRTRGTVFTKRVTTGTLDLGSAEWIAEAPSACSRRACPRPLANFGTLTVSRIAATGNGEAGTLTNPAWRAVPIQLVPNAQSLLPGPGGGFVTQHLTAGTTPPRGLTPDGGSFTLSWLASARR